MRRVRFSREVLLASVLSLAVTCSASGAQSPAAPVPEPDGGWLGLEPRVILGDTTFFNDTYEPGCDEPYWFDLAAAGGYLFAAASNVLQVWDIHTSPAAPILLDDPCQQAMVLGPFRKSDTDAYLKSIDVPPGDPSVVVAGLHGMGLMIYTFNSSTGLLRRVYQDEGEIGTGQSISNVSATTLSSGAHYAFAVEQFGKVLAYNLSAAAAIPSPFTCIDGSQAGQVACTGVYVGRPFSFSVGSPLATAGDFLAVSRGSSGTEVYDMSVPLSPQLKGRVADRPWNLTMWQTNGKTYLAIQRFDTVEIHDVDCLSGSCTSLVAMLQTPSPSTTPMNKLQASQDGNLTFLYSGTTYPLDGPQKEYLFDVTELPNGYTSIPVTPAGEEYYFTWYYQFRKAAPYGGVAYGGHFYRSLYSILDVHALTHAVAPVADFLLPAAPVFATESVDFVDTSNAIPTSWSWFFDGSVTPDSTEQDATWVVPYPFSPASPPQPSDYPRQYDVTLEACNTVGCDQISKSLVVQDPRPIYSIEGNVSTASVCSTITFAAVGQGARPLTFDWIIKDSGGSLVEDLGSGQATQDWFVPFATPLGSYSAEVTVTNAADTLVTSSPVVDIGALPTLALSSLSMDVPVGRLVQFHLDAAGATRWTWDFGDGSAPVVYTDPTQGAHPSHSYPSEFLTGTVEVTIENCRDGQMGTTLDLELLPDLLINDFRAQVTCVLGLCGADQGSPIVFVHDVEGPPDFYDYDWDGDGTFEDSGRLSPSSSHAYWTAGVYQPVLRVRRGADEVSYQNLSEFEIFDLGLSPMIFESGFERGDLTGWSASTP